MGTTKPRKGMSRKRAERVEQVLQLREAGIHLNQIAKKFGVSTTQIHKDVRDGIQSIYREQAESLAQLELMRLDRMQAGLYPEATKGNVKAVNGVLRIMERRAKLLGLDSAIKLEVDQNPAEYLEQLMAAIRDDPTETSSAQPTE